VAEIGASGDKLSVAAVKGKTEFAVRFAQLRLAALALPTAPTVVVALDRDVLTYPQLVYAFA
jgi:hypothetical protein